MLCKGWDGFHARKRDEENIYTKMKRKGKDGISQVGVVTWVVFIFTLVNAILLGPI